MRKVFILFCLISLLLVVFSSTGFKIHLPDYPIMDRYYSKFISVSPSLQKSILKCMTCHPLKDIFDKFLKLGYLSRGCPYYVRFCSSKSFWTHLHCEDYYALADYYYSEYYFLSLIEKEFAIKCSTCHSLEFIVEESTDDFILSGDNIDVIAFVQDGCPYFYKHPEKFR